MTARVRIALALLLVSLAGACVTPPRVEGQSCLFNDDCAKPLVCASRQCRAPCADDRDCVGGWRCSATERPEVRVCLPPGARRACEFASDCAPSGFACYRRECYETCSIDAPCAGGQSCVGGVCFERSAPLDASMPADAASPEDARDASVDASSDALPPSNTRVVELCASGRRTCARTRDGSVFCWGASNGGALGYIDPMLQAVPTPVRVVLPARATMIRCPTIDGPFSVLPDTHTCAALEDGTVSCWGANQSGQSNPSMPAMRVVLPSIVAGVRDVVEIATGLDFSCALDRAGRVQCWGSNRVNQLGRPDATMVASSILPEPASTIAAGRNWACARALRSQALYCWGGTTPVAGDALGEYPFALEATGPAPAGGIAFLAAGREVLFALSPTGALVAVGSSFDGHLGVATPMRTTTFVQPRGVDDVYDVAVGTAHACALRFDGTVQCWGNASSGRLGFVTAASRELPGARVSLSSVASIAAGYEHTCAATANGEVYCWGAFALGALGAEGAGSTAAPQRVVFR